MRRSALVTGASRGIGRAIAAALAREGWPVCVNYLQRRDAAEALVSELRARGHAAMAFQADVADREAVAAMVQAASEALGPVELLVNNAGVSQYGLFQDVDDAAWNRVLAVNLTGPRNAIQAVLPHMLDAKRGCVVNISSMWGLRGASCETTYAAAKAGLIGLTRSLALELAPSGIGGGGLPGVGPGVLYYRAGADGGRGLHCIGYRRTKREGGPASLSFIDSGTAFRCTAQCS